MRNHIIVDENFKRFHTIVDEKTKDWVRLIKTGEYRGTYDEIKSAEAQVI